MKLQLAITPMQRLIGLKAVKDGKLLLIAPCRDIHTFGMTKPIDIAFINKQGEVVHSERSVHPLQRKRCAQAVAVLERFEQTHVPWFEEGEQLEFLPTSCWDSGEESGIHVNVRKGES